jgi:hypothetical protein
MWLKMQISSSLDMKRHAYVSYCHHFVPVAIISLAMRLYDITEILLKVVLNSINPNPFTPKTQNWY